MKHTVRIGADISATPFSSSAEFVRIGAVDCASVCIPVNEQASGNAEAQESSRDACAAGGVAGAREPVDALVHAARSATNPGSPSLATSSQVSYLVMGLQRAGLAAAQAVRLSPDSQLTRAAVCRLMCKEAHMATNLAIDPDLLERALEVSGERTKKAAVTRALQEFIARREQARILDLFGSVEIDPEYDYKAERSRG
jgi:Arc/MetJ family transcription regulator